MNQSSGRLCHPLSPTHCRSWYLGEIRRVFGDANKHWRALGIELTLPMLELFLCLGQMFATSTEVLRATLIRVCLFKDLTPPKSK